MKYKRLLFKKAVSKIRFENFLYKKDYENFSKLIKSIVVIIH